MVAVASGMVLCASNEDHTKVEPLQVPEGCQVGERIKFEGAEGEPGTFIAVLEHSV